MSMTRKDFALIAEAIRLSYIIADEPGDTHGISMTETAIANVLAREYPRFDRDRFVAACNAV